MRFSEIAGQIKTINKLIRSYQDGRVSHAQLLWGPDGCGSLAVSIAYATFVNCTNKQFYDDNSPVIGDSCGKCLSCKKSDKLIHPDIHFVFPTNKTKNHPKKLLSADFLPEWREFLNTYKYYVDINHWYDFIEIENQQGIISAEECNEIINILNYKTYEAEFKIMIVWMIEKLFYSAAPKILKILEEPQDKTLFLLVSENHHLILDTIISRTQPIRLKKIAQSEIKFFLTNKLNIDVNKADELLVKYNSNLSDITGNIISGSDDSNMMNLFIEWMRACFRKNTEQILEISSKFSVLGRERQKDFISFAINQLRNSYMQKYSKSLCSNIFTNNIEFYSKFGQYLNTESANILIEELEKTSKYVERNANTKILFTDISLKIGYLLT